MHVQHGIFHLREGLDAVYFPAWRSTTRGSTTCHHVVTPGVWLENVQWYPLVLKLYS